MGATARHNTTGLGVLYIIAPFSGLLPVERYRQCDTDLLPFMADTVPLIILFRAQRLYAFYILSPRGPSKSFGTCFVFSMRHMMCGGMHQRGAHEGIAAKNGISDLCQRCQKGVCVAVYFMFHPKVRGCACDLNQCYRSKVIQQKLVVPNGMFIENLDISDNCLLFRTTN